LAHTSWSATKAMGNRTLSKAPSTAGTSSCTAAYGGADQYFKLGRQDSDHGHFALAVLTTCENNSVRATPRWLSTLSVFHSESFLYGGFVWARRALSREKRRFPGRAVLPHAPVGKEKLTTTSVGQSWLVVVRDGACSGRARPRAITNHHYMTQPLVELYGGCMVVLKVS
jgi:hypothetical protein